MTQFVVCATSLRFAPSRCTGKERDTESGNDYFGARYYASSMGRFLSPDPLGGKLANPQSLNRYSYTYNNPLTNTDPTGMYVCDDSTECDSDSDKAFAKSLQSARDATVGLTGADWAAATRAINAYGDQGVDNGVSVKFADNLQGGASGLTAVGGTANGNRSDDNKTGQNIQVTFENDKIGGPLGASLAAHEGSHVADGSAWVGSGFSQGMDPTRYQTEITAYQVQFNILQSNPFFGSLIGVKIGNAPVYAGQSFKDFMPALQQGLAASPLYGFTYQDQTPAFVKGLVLPQ